MLRKSASLLFAAGAALALAAQPASAQKQKLTMAYFWGPTHHMSDSQKEWVKTIEKASNGNLTVEIDTSGIGSPRGQYDLVKDGVRDVVWFVAGYTPGRFSLYQVAELPFVCPNATTCGPALWEWYTGNDLHDREFKETKLLVAFNHGPGVLHSRRGASAIRTVDQMANVKVRAGGSNVAIGKALDMAVVSMPASDAYEALERNTVDAIFFPWEAVTSFRLNDVTSFHLEIPGGFYSSSFGININPKALDGLTAENRKALMEASGKAGSKLFGELWDAADAVARDEAMKSDKHTIETIPAAEMPKLREKLDVVRKDWIDMANGKGLNGEKLYEDFLAKVRANSS